MTDPHIVAGGAVTNDELNDLFAAAWPGHLPREFQSVLSRSLDYFTIHDNRKLIGFVYLAWDGGCHAFLLDPTVHPAFRHRGFGTRLVKQAAEAARCRGVEWLHVDFEPELESFYVGAGFRVTTTGVWNLAGPSK